MRLALAPVTRYAWLIVDQRKAFADEPVEQRRFADIRPPDYRNSGQHLARVLPF
jgi:hypothetical protein